MKIFKRLCIFCLLILLTSALFAETSSFLSQEWFINLRDAVYEQRLSSNEVLSIYTVAKNQAEIITQDVQKYIMLARCENLMGMAYQKEGINSEAIAHYERSEYYAKSALNIQATSDAHYALAESISLQCDIKGFSYQIANGMRFVNSANNAISLNQNNTEARYLLAAMYAFPNPPFRNLNRAKRTLEEIIENHNEYMSNDVRFNVYYAMGVVFQKQRQPVEARTWFNRALILYPTNIDVQNRLKEI